MMKYKLTIEVTAEVEVPDDFDIMELGERTNRVADELNSNLEYSNNDPDFRDFVAVGLVPEEM